MSKTNMANPITGHANQLDAKIEFYTRNYLTIADDRMLARLSQLSASTRKENK